MNRTSLEQRTTQNLARCLGRAAIPYALAGGVAVEFHGAQRWTSGVQVLLTKTGLDAFRTDFVPAKYNSVPGRSRRFVDRDNGINVEVFLTGHYPCRTSPGPFQFPDPVRAGQEIDGICVLALPRLIECQLAAGRYSELAEVVSLIQMHNLDESYLPQLHPAVHRSFVQCLEEKRRDEEWERLQDLAVLGLESGTGIEPHDA